MAYKKLKYNDFPRMFDRHVIIDVRTMTTHPTKGVTAVSALASHIHDLGEAEFNRLPEEDRREIGDVTMDEAMRLLTGRLLGNASTDSLFDVIKAGPFQVTGGDIARKNMNFALERYVAIAAGSSVTEEDLVAAAWVQDHQEASRVRRESVNEEDEMTVQTMMESIFGKL